MRTIEFVVPAVPVAQPRVRAGVIGGHAHVYEAGKKHPIHSFKATVAQHAYLAYQGAPLTGPITMSLTFLMPRPKSMIWKKRDMPRVPCVKKPDVDNLVKSVLDAINGFVFVDDSQVYRIAIGKLIASGDEQPHVEVSIYHED